MLGKMSWWGGAQKAQCHTSFIHVSKNIPPTITKIAPSSKIFLFKNIRKGWNNLERESLYNRPNVKNTHFSRYSDLSQRFCSLIVAVNYTWQALPVWMNKVSERDRNISSKSEYFSHWICHRNSLSKSWWILTKLCWTNFAG